MSAHAAQPDALTSAIRAGNPAPDDRTGDAPAGALGEQIDAALADAHTKAEAVVDDADAQSAEALEAQLADALKDSSAAPRAAAPASTLPAAPAPSPEMAALDEQIASKAASLDDDFLSPEDALAGESSPPIAGHEPATAASETPAASAVAAGAPAATIDAQPAPAPAPSPASAPAVTTQPPTHRPSPPPQPTATTQPAGGAASSAPPATPQPSNGVSIGEMVAGAIEPLAVRLGRLPRPTQQTIGWIALLTIFHAGIVWAYVLLKAPPTFEEPIGKQPTLVDDHGAPVVPVVGRTPPPKPAAPVGAKGDDHGAPTKEDHGAAKSAGGH